MKNVMSFNGMCFKTVLTGIVTTVCVAVLFIFYNIMAALLSVGALLLRKKPKDCIMSLTNGFITVCNGFRRQIG